MSDDTSEVTAQLSAAFNAVHDAAAYILGRRAALELTPIGRQWIEDAEAMKRLEGDPA